MGERVDSENVQTLERVCDPVTVTVSDTRKDGRFTLSRTVAVRLGACRLEDFLTIIASVSEAARMVGGEGA